ncbi:hypothetical protein NFI96_023216, partial [Prochilodus magdalenae]
FGTPANHSENHYPQMAKMWNSGETFPDDQNYPKSDNSSKWSQKTPQQYLKNCRPHLSRVRWFMLENPPSVAELQQFYKDEWAKITPQRCERLIASCRKHLIAVVVAKGGETIY